VALATAVMATVPGTSLAQAVDLTDLRICADLATDELKLACFEAIVATGSRSGSDSDESGEGGAELETPPLHAGMDKLDDVVEPSGPEDVAGTNDDNLADSSSESTLDSFGREQLQSQKDDKPTMAVGRVVEVSRSKDRSQALQFHLESGQVWRQIEARYFSYPKNEPFDVTISQGMMGDYRLRVGTPDDSGRMVRVRRIR